MISTPPVWERHAEGQQTERPRKSAGGGGGNEENTHPGNTWGSKRSSSKVPVTLVPNPNYIRTVSRVDRRGAHHCVRPLRRTLER